MTNPRKYCKSGSKATNFATLYEASLPASRSGALYNAFSYPTKISPESIALFIATHTNPGDIILDVFGGSGAVTLARKSCDLEIYNDRHSGLVAFYKCIQDEEKLTEAAIDALKQIKKSRYTGELQSRGITNICQMGISFSGKNVKIVI